MSAAAGLARIVGKYGACNLAPANILLDAFLPLVGSWPLPAIGGLHYGFEHHEEDGGYWTDMGGWLDEEDVLVTPTGYSPIMPLTWNDIIHTAATAHGDKRMGHRFLTCQIDIEDSPHQSGTGPDPWPTKTAEEEELPDFGLLTKRKHRLTWNWDPTQDPERWVNFEAKTDFGESGDYTVWWTLNRQADGTLAEVQTAIGWALLNRYDFGGQCNPSAWVYALNAGGSAEVTYGYGPSSFQTVLDATCTLPVGDAAAGTYTFKLTITKSMMYSPETGPTDEPATWLSLHDQVQALLDDVDLTDLTRIYEFNDSVGGVGTPKSMQLSPGNMYYLVPFWKVDPGTGLRSTERMLDCLKVPCRLNSEFAFPYTGRWDGCEADIWMPRGDWGEGDVLADGGVAAAANLGVGWGDSYPVPGGSPGWSWRAIEGFLNGGLSERTGTNLNCFDLNLLFKVQRRLRVRDSRDLYLEEYPAVVGNPPLPDNIISSTVARPTLHLTKARVVEDVKVCAVQYSSDFGTEPSRWPTAADPDDGGAPASDVSTIDSCNGVFGTGNLAVDWGDLTTPTGKGMMVLLRTHQAPVDNPNYVVIGEHPTWSGTMFNDVDVWPGCCTPEEGVEP